MKKFADFNPHPIMQSLKHIYGSIPLPIRYGRLFRETYSFLQESQWWSKNRLEQYQLQQLDKLLCHAYENVPYYRKIFDEQGIKPKDIHNLNDLKKIPLLTKHILKTETNQFVARNYKKAQLLQARTSGSTGSPLNFFHRFLISIIFSLGTSTW